MTELELPAPSADRPILLLRMPGEPNDVAVLLDQKQVDALVEGLWPMSSYGSHLECQILESRIEDLEIAQFNMRGDFNLLKGRLEDCDSALLEAQERLRNLRGAADA